VLYTDNEALRWLESSSSRSHKLTRWSLEIFTRDIKILHKPGKLNVVADALTRAPIQPSELEQKDLDEIPDVIYVPAHVNSLTYCVPDMDKLKREQHFDPEICEIIKYVET